MSAPLMLAGDTRGWTSRGVWPGLGELGELCFYRREDGWWDLLMADPQVVVSHEARQRLGEAQPTFVECPRWEVDELVAFHGVRLSALYRITRYDRPHMLWLLERQD